VLGVARTVGHSVPTGDSVGGSTVGRDAESAVIVGARILAAAAEAHDAGLALAERWAGRLDEAPYHPPAVGAAVGDETRLVL
jgi:hypothetical protein